MSKNNWVALITDSHAGIRGDSEHFMKYQQMFYRDYFFPKCAEYGVKEVYHLGDFFDRRKFINFKTLNDVIHNFLQPIRESGMKMHLLVGNHDVYYKNTNKINQPEMLLDSYKDCVTTYQDAPTIIKLGERDCLLVPWINVSNFKSTMEIIDNSKQSVCFGHFEFEGFEMYAGSPSEEGMTTQGFEKFDLVCSGHFHHKSSRGNITYLGAPFEYTWADCDDERGFHLLNTETLELIYVKNPYTMFKKLQYSDKNEAGVLESFKEADIQDKIVKLIVHNKKNPYLFDQVVDILSSKGQYDLQVVDLVQMDLTEQTQSLEQESKDTLTFIYEYVDAQAKDLEVQTKTKLLMEELYVESMIDEES